MKCMYRALSLLTLMTILCVHLITALVRKGQKTNSAYKLEVTRFLVRVHTYIIGGGC